MNLPYRFDGRDARPVRTVPFYIVGCASTLAPFHALSQRSSLAPAKHRPGAAAAQSRFAMTIVDGARPSGHDYWAKNGRIAREQLSARQCNHPGEALAA